MTHRDDRLESYGKHILVGTTTVDIGVDFHINYLIFEAFNGGSFLQRFGRLGRHEEYPTYRAHALIPRFVLERLELKFGAMAEVERETFNEAIREAFPTEQEFEQYTQRWGVVQAAQVLVELESQGKQDANQPFREALTAQYEQFYAAASGKSVMPNARKKYWFYGKNVPEVIDELQSFRGKSPLSCGIWDSDNHLKTYNLFFLLANADFEVITADAYMQEVRKRDIEERDFKEQLLYLKILGYVPERLQLVLGLHKNLTDNPDVLHHVFATDGLFVHDPRPTWLDEVNRRLKGKKLVGILSDMGAKNSSSA